MAGGERLAAVEIQQQVGLRRDGGRGRERRRVWLGVKDGGENGQQNKRYRTHAGTIIAKRMRARGQSAAHPDRPARRFQQSLRVHGAGRSACCGRRERASPLSGSGQIPKKINSLHRDRRTALKIPDWLDRKSTRLN